MLRMKNVYRYRKERHFAQPPEAIWPFVADSARINEIAGMPAYKVEEQADAQGRIRRLASIKYGPIRVKWEEDFGEWQENRHLLQTRHFINGPFGRFVAAAEVYPEGTGSRMVFSAEFECLGVLGLLAKLSGQIGREGDKRLGAIERMIREFETADQITGAIAREAAKPAARRRLRTLPQGAHCSSCNIDYGRDFTRNVELTFHPGPWLRPLPEGELCLLGQGTTPHVKFQAEVAARTRKSFAMALRPGPYRFRTVEAGGGADADIAADGMIPLVSVKARPGNDGACGQGRA